MKYIQKIYFLILFSLTIPLLAQVSTPIPLKHGAHSKSPRMDADMQRWRDYGLGQFIHWGVYSIPGGEWKGQTTTYAAEWFRSSGLMTTEEYDNLYKQFNPVDFDAVKWAKMAKDMGVKYLIFTTKHHDGFCMWPTKYTEYSIKNSQYGKDIVKELVDAYNEQGIDVFLYYSIIDWSHPGYFSGGNINSPEIKKKYQSQTDYSPYKDELQKKKYEEFKDFTRNQLLELVDTYKDIKGMWFDGSWDVSWVHNAGWVDSLGLELRRKHPGLIIGSRFRSDELGNRHEDANGYLIDDYDQRYERNLPRNMAETKGFDWDCVMTIPENQWGYHRNWSFSYIKTPYDLIGMLLQANSLNGNLVINFGPDGKGNFRKEEQDIASNIGKWMNKNSEAVYGTGLSILEKQDWGYSTQKDSIIYLAVLNKPLNKQLRVKIPAASDKAYVYVIEKAQMLDSGKAVKMSDNIKKNTSYREKTGAVFYDLILPETAGKSGLPFVIKIKIKKIKKGDLLHYQQALT